MHWRARLWCVVLLASAGLAHPLAAGQLIGWGAGYVGPAYLPTNLTDIATFTAHDGHSLVLRTDGTVTNLGSFLWSDNHSGYIYVQPGLSNIVALAAGYGHDLVLRRDGVVLGWGYPTQIVTANLPVNLTGVASMATHYKASVALRVDGSLEAWTYDNNYAWLRNIPQGLLNNVVKVAAGAYHLLALKADGTVVAWGHNSYGQSTVPLGLSNVVDVSASWSHNLALKADGSVVAWGNNSQGQLYVAPGLRAVAICAAGYHSIAVRANGTVVIWGDNYYGQGVVPVGITNVAAIAGGRYNTIALIGDVPPYPTALPSSVTLPYGGRALLPASCIGTRPLHYQWRFNGNDLPLATNLALSLENISFSDAGRYDLLVSNAFGTATNSFVLNVAPLAFAQQPKSQTVFAETMLTLNATAAGAPPIYFQWRFNGTNLPGATNSSLVISNARLQDTGTYSVEASNAYATLVSSNANVEVLPLGIIGQPQDQAVIRRGTAIFNINAVGVTPLIYQWQFNGTELPGATQSSLVLNDVRPYQTGSYSAIVRNAYATMQSVTGRLYIAELVGWGGNSKGELNIPKGLNSIVAISAGDGSDLALRSNGTVVAWGDNSFGQTNVPSGLSNVVAIAAGGFFNLALKANGTIVAWGDNFYGQTNMLPGLSNVVAIAGGVHHALALTGDGRVYGWGRNVEGQVDIPSTVTNAVAIAAARYQSIALHLDGTVSTWGNDPYGLTNLPAGLANVTAIACATRHSLALQVDGSVQAWGDNYYGQTDVPVSLLTNLVGISANFYHSLALRADGTVVGWGNNLWGQTNVPSGLSNVLAIACGHYHSLALLGDAPPVLQVSLMDPSWSSGNFGLRLQTRSGRVYALETITSLADSNWTTLPLAVGNGAILQLVDPSASEGQRFYRVREW